MSHQQLQRSSLPSNLPVIETAALPETYERARVALAACLKIDECKDWADKMAALASYAKQAEDQSLHHFAVRISSRAIRRVGELLQAFESQGARTDLEPSGGAPTKLTQRQAATQAGLSKDQEVTAVRVANVPVEEFETLVESADPPTITKLAELGTQTQPKPPVPEEFPAATHILGVLRKLVLFCAEHPAALVGEAVMPHEVNGFRADVEAMEHWWAECLDHVPGVTSC